MFSRECFDDPVLPELFLHVKITGINSTSKLHIDAMSIGIPPDEVMVGHLQLLIGGGVRWYCGVGWSDWPNLDESSFPDYKSSIVRSVSVVRLATIVKQICYQCLKCRKILLITEMETIQVCIYSRTVNHLHRPLSSNTDLKRE